MDCVPHESFVPPVHMFVLEMQEGVGVRHEAIPLPRQRHEVQHRPILHHRIIEKWLALAGEELTPPEILGRIWQQTNVDSGSRCYHHVLRHRGFGGAQGHLTQVLPHGQPILPLRAAKLCLVAGGICLGAIDVEMASDGLPRHEVRHGDDGHALGDAVEGEKVSEVVCVLVTFPFIEEVQRLVRRQDEDPARGQGEYQHSLHLHADVVPTSYVRLEGYVLRRWPGCRVRSYVV